MSTTFWIKIENWEKYQPRKDLKKPWYFALSNTLAEDSDFYDFSHGEFKAWIYLMSKASQKTSSTIRVVPAHAERVCNISTEDLSSAIEKLQLLGALVIIKNPELVRDDVDSRTEHVQIADGSCTEGVHTPTCRVEESRGEEKKQDKKKAEETSTPPVFGNGEMGAIEPFSQSKILMAPLSKVPKNLQQVWIDQWGDQRWIIKTLEKTFQKRLAAGAGTNEDWSKTFTTWLFSERDKPKSKHIKVPTEPSYELTQEQAWDVFQANLKARGVDSFIKLFPGTKGAH